jgi:hypothetical protein
MIDYDCKKCRIFKMFLCFCCTPFNYKHKYHFAIYIRDISHKKQLFLSISNILQTNGKLVEKRENIFQTKGDENENIASDFHRLLLQRIFSLFSIPTYYR